MEPGASGGHPKGLRIHWDEKNLSINEKIKSELNPTKIDEPKTPFHSPPREEIDFTEYDPAKECMEGHQDGMPEGHCTGGVSAFDADELAARLLALQKDQMTSESAPDDKKTLSMSEGENAQTQSDFSAQRKAHYNMAAALKRGQDAMETEEEEEEPQ